jgi:hypothetical protein
VSASGEWPEAYTKEIESLFEVFFFVGLESGHPCFKFSLDESRVSE